MLKLPKLPHSIKLVITCEHAVNTIPKPYQALFAAHQGLLNTHRGKDIGAQHMAQKLVNTFHLPYFEATTSRLLIDYNRSLHHPDCFSIVSHSFDKKTKQEIIDNYYLPHREPILACMQHIIDKKQMVLHWAIHSFTPIYNGITRDVDVGLLYDPGRKLELAFAKAYQKWLSSQAPAYRIRRNVPYQGKTDGLATYCRKRFKETDYVGFEMEFNQGLLNQPTQQKHLEALFCKLVGEIIASF